MDIENEKAPLTYRIKLENVDGIGPGEAFTHFEQMCIVRSHRLFELHRGVRRFTSPASQSLARNSLFALGLRLFGHRQFVHICAGDSRTA